MSDAMSGLSQKDTVVIDAVNTPDEKLWITIKDASDLLGYSERHMWRIVQKNAWESRKQLNISRKKTYVLRSDVEIFYKAEKERRKLEALKDPSSDIPVLPDKKAELDKTDLSMEGTLSGLSDKKTLPVILTEYKQIILDHQAKQEKLIKKSTLWKTTAIWISVIVILVSGIMTFWLSDLKISLSDTKKTLVTKERALSDNLNALSVNQKALADKEKLIVSLEENVEAKTGAIDSMKEEILKQASWINALEQNISKKRLGKLRMETE